MHGSLVKKILLQGVEAFVPTSDKSHKFLQLAHPCLLPFPAWIWTHIFSNVPSEKIPYLRVLRLLLYPCSPESWWPTWSCPCKRDCPSEYPLETEALFADPSVIIKANNRRSLCSRTTEDLCPFVIPREPHFSSSAGHRLQRKYHQAL